MAFLTARKLSLGFQKHASVATFQQDGKAVMAVAQVATLSDLKINNDGFSYSMANLT